MKIMMDFKGGLCDGTFTLDREIKAGESYNFAEWIISIVGVTSNYRYNVGHHFHVPSPGWLARTVVRQPTPHGVSDTFEYEIVDRLEHDDELIVVAKYIGQRPDYTPA
jgi:hypothetical protein